MRKMKKKALIACGVFTLIGVYLFFTSDKDEKNLRMEKVAITESALDDIYTGVDESEVYEESSVAYEVSVTSVDDVDLEDEDDTSTELEEPTRGEAYWNKILERKSGGEDWGKFLSETKVGGKYVVEYEGGVMEYFLRNDFARFFSREILEGDMHD